jgi:hypothetical protein
VKTTRLAFDSIDLHEEASRRGSNAAGSQATQSLDFSLQIYKSHDRRGSSSTFKPSSRATMLFPHPIESSNKMIITSLQIWGCVRPARTNSSIDHRAITNQTAVSPQFTGTNYIAERSDEDPNYQLPTELERRPEDPPSAHPLLAFIRPQPPRRATLHTPPAS